MHSLLEILRQSDNISLLKHTGFNTKRNEAMMNATQKNEILKGAMDWALSNGFNYHQALGYADEFLKMEIENPSFSGSELTPFSMGGN
jgi:hypothetical protein